jgi:hypothetical protein
LASPISLHTWIDTIKIMRMIKLIRIILYKYGLRVKLKIDKKFIKRLRKKLKILKIKTKFKISKTKGTKLSV